MDGNSICRLKRRARNFLDLVRAEHKTVSDPVAVIAMLKRAAEAEYLEPRSIAAKLNDCLALMQVGRRLA